VNVLIGFESSGVMREAFRALGINAYSCDLQDADDGSPHHYKCDIWEIAENSFWNFGMFHPTCTYLAISAAWAFKDGPYHQKIKLGTIVGAERREKRAQSLLEIERIMKLKYPNIIENPVGFIGSMLKKPTQIIQPYDFGDDASKKTCLWLSDGLKPIEPTQRRNGRWVLHKGIYVERWSNQTDSGQNNLPPNQDRWKVRSKTYQGVANAIAAQITQQLQTF